MFARCSATNASIKLATAAKITVDIVFSFQVYPLGNDPSSPALQAGALTITAIGTNIFSNYCTSYSTNLQLIYLFLSYLVELHNHCEVCRFDVSFFSFFFLGWMRRIEL